MNRKYSQPKNAWGIVTRREIIAKLTDKAFISGTIGTLLMMVVASVLAGFLGSRGSTAEVAVVDKAAAQVVTASDAVAKANNDKNSITAMQVADEAEARAKVTEGEVDAYLVKKDDSWTLVFHREPDTMVQNAITTTVQSLALNEVGQKAGMTPQQLTKATTIQTDLIDGTMDKAMLAMVAGFAFAILFFMSALTFGMQIAGSVVEEKASRIVEIISAAIPVRHLLAGKIIGNTILAFAQMALFAIVGLVAVSFTPFKELLPSLSTAVVWFLVYFVAGFLALACIWAVAGSLASRQEDLQTTTAPLTTVLMVAYMAGFFAKGTVAVVLSYVPVLSSVLMPMRLVAGEAQWWELVIGLVLNLAFAAVAVLVGEKIYRRSLLQTQGLITYREAFKLTD